MDPKNAPFLGISSDLILNFFHCHNKMTFYETVNIYIATKKYRCEIVFRNG